MGKITIEKETKYDTSDIILFSQNKKAYIGIIVDYVYNKEDDTIGYSVIAEDLPLTDICISFFTVTISEDSIVGAISEQTLSSLKDEYELYRRENGITS